jgi:hypothetical protein
MAINHPSNERAEDLARLQDLHAKKHDLYYFNQELGRVIKKKGLGQKVDVLSSLRKISRKVNAIADEYSQKRPKIADSFDVLGLIKDENDDYLFRWPLIYSKEMKELDELTLLVFTICDRVGVTPQLVEHPDATYFVNSSNEGGMNFFITGMIYQLTRFIPVRVKNTPPTQPLLLGRRSIQALLVRAHALATNTTTFLKKNDFGKYEDIRLLLMGTISFQGDQLLSKQKSEKLIKIFLSLINFAKLRVFSESERIEIIKKSYISPLDIIGLISARNVFDKFVGGGKNRRKVYKKDTRLPKMVSRSNMFTNEEWTIIKSIFSDIWASTAIPETAVHAAIANGSFSKNLRKRIKSNINVRRGIKMRLAHVTTKRLKLIRQLQADQGSLKKRDVTKAVLGKTLKTYGRSYCNTLYQELENILGDEIIFASRVRFQGKSDEDCLDKYNHWLSQQVAIAGNILLKEVEMDDIILQVKKDVSAAHSIADHINYFLDKVEDYTNFLRYIQFNYYLYRANKLHFDEKFQPQELEAKEAEHDSLSITLHNWRKMIFISDELLKSLKQCKESYKTFSFWPISQSKSVEEIREAIRNFSRSCSSHLKTYSETKTVPAFRSVFKFNSALNTLNSRLSFNSATV